MTIGSKRFFTLRQVDNAVASGLIFGFLLLWTGPLYAALFYVSPAGSDTNPGTVELPWRTIGRANATLQPGDTVFIMNGEYREQIAPVNSGTAGNYITYSAYLNDTPVITAPPRVAAEDGERIAILLIDRSFIRITGLTITGQAPFLNSNIDRWALLRRANNNIFENSVFRFARGFRGFDMQDSNFNQILNNSMDHVGDYDRNSGEVITLICSNNNLIQGNTLSRGGHDILPVYGDNNVIRENLFNNQWGPNQNIIAFNSSE